MSALLLTFLLSVAQTPAPVTVAALVRDGGGAPLAGLRLDLLLSGPPHEALDTCLSDAAGACHFSLPPGAYLLQVSGGLNGLRVIDPAEQNAGVMADGGAAGGGFGFYLRPGDPPQTIALVLGQQGEHLVPLWDMSRSADAPPQPFFPDQQTLSVDLAPLGPTLSAAPSPEAEAAPAPTVGPVTPPRTVAAGRWLAALLLGAGLACLGWAALSLLRQHREG